MRKLWMALLFCLGGMAHEWRTPTHCHCVAASSGPGLRKRPPA